MTLNDILVDVEAKYDPLERNHPVHPWGVPELTQTKYGVAKKYPYEGFITRNRFLIYYEVSFVRRELDKLQHPDLKVKDIQHHVSLLEKEFTRLVETIERVLVELGDIDPSHNVKDGEA